MKLPAASIKKIALFRALQLGDMLCSIPAVRSLRKAYPSAAITLLGLPWAAALIKRFPHYFDNFIHFPGYPDLPEQPFDPHTFLLFLHTVQHEKYDLVLQMQGNGTLVNPMVGLFGGQHTCGYFYKDVYYPHNGLFIEYPENCHEIERHLKLMEHLGLESLDTEMEFPLYKQDIDELYALNLPVIYKEYVCLHPGSRGSWRQWPPEHFAALADNCAIKGFKIIITGTHDEEIIMQKVAALMKHDAIVIAGKTSLGAMGELIQNACLLIANCTGVSHIAAATKTPSIVISMDGEPERWAPLNHQLHRTIDWTTNNEFEEVIRELNNLLAIYGELD